MATTAIRAYDAMFEDQGVDASGAADPGARQRSGVVQITVRADGGVVELDRPTGTGGDIQRLGLVLEVGSVDVSSEALVVTAEGGGDPIVCQWSSPLPLLATTVGSTRTGSAACDAGGEHRVADATVHVAESRLVELDGHDVVAVVVERSVDMRDTQGGASGHWDQTLVVVPDGLVVISWDETSTAEAPPLSFRSTARYQLRGV